MGAVTWLHLGMGVVAMATHCVWFGMSMSDDVNAVCVHVCVQKVP